MSFWLGVILLLSHPVLSTDSLRQFGNVAQASPEFRTCQCWHMLFHDILLQLARTVGSMHSLVLSDFFCRPKSYGSKKQFHYSIVPFCSEISHVHSHVHSHVQTNQKVNWCYTDFQMVCGEFQTADVLDLMGINSMNQNIKLFGQLLFFFGDKTIQHPIAHIQQFWS